MWRTGSLRWTVVLVLAAAWCAGDEGAEQAYVGVHLQEMDPQLAGALGLEEPRGAVITDVVPGSPAERMGLQAGDVVVEIDGETVEGPQDVVDAVRRRRPGDRIRIAAVREGGRIEATFPLGEYGARSAPGPDGAPSRPRGWVWRWESDRAPDMPWEHSEPPEGPWREWWRGGGPPGLRDRQPPFRFELAPPAAPPGWDDKTWERHRNEMEKMMRRLFEEYAGRIGPRRPAPGRDPAAPQTFEGWDERLMELERRLDALRDGAEALKRQFGDRLESLRESGGEHGEKLRAMMRQMQEEFGAQLRERAGSLERLQGRSSKLEMEVRRLREENEDLRREMQDAKRALDELTAEMRRERRDRPGNP